MLIVRYGSITVVCVGYRRCHDSSRDHHLPGAGQPQAANLGHLQDLGTKGGGAGGCHGMVGGKRGWRMSWNRVPWEAGRCCRIMARGGAGE